MFKRPPQTKPATPLRSSTRRQLLTILQQVYPILNSASPELIAEIVPEGIKQCSASNTNGVKVVLYTEPDKAGKPGRPLWWEAGNDNGAWINNKKTANAALPEILPTIYSLWLVPNLLPVLPTWPQVIESALLGGSALMVPGLIPSPHTFATTSAHPHLPTKSSLVAIAGHPSDVPQVLARLDLDMTQIVQLRAQGEKGKAATTLHAYKDGLWELGGKGSLPEHVTPLQSQPETDVPETTSADVSAVAQDVQTVSIQDAPESTANHSPPPTSTSNFTTTEIDQLLYLALLSSIQELSSSSASSDPFPISASAFYSSYVLPHRPSHWPPRPPRGKRAKASKGQRSGAPGSYGQQFSSDYDQELTLNPDQVVVPKSSAKKLTKWIKLMDKDGLIKLKETRGDANVVEINPKHPHVANLTPFQTYSDVHDASIREHTGLSHGQDSTTVAAAASDSSDHSSAPNTSVHVQSLYALATNKSAFVPLFDVLTLAPPLSADGVDMYTSQELRRALLEYVNAHCEPVQGNQALVRPNDILRDALSLKTIQLPPSRSRPSSQSQSQSASATPLKRDEITKKFMSECVVEYTRISRLTPSNLSHLQKTGTINIKEDASLSSGEFVGKFKKQSASASALVKITLKRRQGNKIVSLITGLESVGIDAKKWAAEVMRSIGTSTSVSTLQASTAKNTLYEVLVQGDQRKVLLEKLAKGNGVDKKYVQVVEPK